MYSVLIIPVLDCCSQWGLDSAIRFPGGNGTSFMEPLLKIKSTVKDTLARQC